MNPFGTQQKNRETRVGKVNDDMVDVLRSVVYDIECTNDSVVCVESHDSDIMERVRYFNILKCMCSKPEMVHDNIINEIQVDYDGYKRGVGVNYVTGWSNIVWMEDSNIVVKIKVNGELFAQAIFMNDIARDSLIGSGRFNILVDNSACMMMLGQTILIAISLSTYHSVVLSLAASVLGKIDFDSINGGSVDEITLIEDRLVFTPNREVDFVTSRRGRRKRLTLSSGLVRRSARFRSDVSSLFGRLSDSSAKRSTLNLGSGMISVYGSEYIPYALGSLSTSQLCKLADDISFIFTDVKLDVEG